MVQRRPLVLSGNFSQEADNTDAVPILGSIVYGSGLFNQFSSFTVDSTTDVYLAPQASGLIFVPDGGEQKLGDDGITLISGQAAYVQSVLAQEGVEPAYASGLEAQRIAVEALASGNQALLNNETALFFSQFATFASQQALASGADAVDAAENALIENGYAIASGEYALGSGIAANEDAVGALSSGNAALYSLATNPFIDEESLLGLIFSLS